MRFGDNNRQQTKWGNIYLNASNGRRSDTYKTDHGNGHGRTYMKEFFIVLAQQSHKVGCKALHKFDT